MTKIIQALLMAVLITSFFLPTLPQAFADHRPFAFVGATADYEVLLAGGGLTYQRCPASFSVTSVVGADVTFVLSQDCFTASGPDRGLQISTSSIGPWTKDETTSSHDSCVLDPFGNASPFFWLKENPTIGTTVTCMGSVHTVIGEGVTTVLGEERDVWITSHGPAFCGSSPTFCPLPNGDTLAYSITFILMDKETGIMLRTEGISYDPDNIPISINETVISKTNILSCLELTNSWNNVNNPRAKQALEAQMQELGCEIPT